MHEVKFFYEDPIDLNEIAQTFQLAFGKPISINWLKWRFNDNPNSDKSFIAYIKKDNKVIGCCSGAPCKLIIENRGEFKYFQTHTCFIHPDYHHQGLFQIILDQLFKRIYEEGFIGEINLCNHNSHAGYRKIKKRTELSVLNFFQTDNKLFRSKLLGTSAQHYEIIEGEVNDKILKLATLMNFNTGSIYFSRNEATLNWRFYQIPTKKYKFLSINHNGSLLSIIIFKDYEGMADIMEFFFDKDCEADRYRIFAAGINYLLEKGRKKINMWSNLHSEEHIELEKFGFQETVFSTYLGVVLFNVFPELTQYKNWHYRFMDSDVF